MKSPPETRSPPNVEQDSDPGMRWYREHLDGDPEAFARMERHYGPKVLRFAERRLGEYRNDAQDIVQAAWQSVWHGRKYDMERKFEPWFFAVVDHLCIDYLRRMNRRKTVSYDRGGNVWLPLRDTIVDPAFDEQGESRATTRVTKERVLQILHERKVPERIIATFFLLVDDMEYQDIAKELEIPIGTVKTRIFRARQVLREALSASRPAR